MYAAASSEASVEHQDVVRLAPGGEPVLAIDLLPESLESRELVVTQVRHRFALGHHDLQVHVVHPDPPPEVTPAAADPLRLHVKHVAHEFVHLLLSPILDLVLGKLLRGQREGLQVEGVVQIFSRQDQRFESPPVVDDAMLAFPIAGEKNLDGHLPLLTHPAGTGQDLKDNMLRVGVLLPDLAEFRLFPSEPLNDLLGIHLGSGPGTRGEEHKERQYRSSSLHDTKLDASPPEKGLDKFHSNSPGEVPSTGKGPRPREGFRPWRRRGCRRGWRRRPQRGGNAPRSSPGRGCR